MTPGDRVAPAARTPGTPDWATTGTVVAVRGDRIHVRWDGALYGADARVGSTDEIAFGVRTFGHYHVAERNTLKEDR